MGIGESRVIFGECPGEAGSSHHGKHSLAAPSSIGVCQKCENPRLLFLRLFILDVVFIYAVSL
jgi:hypothetical protein